MLPTEILGFHQNTFFYFTPKFPKEKKKHSPPLHPEVPPKFTRLFLIYLSSKSNKNKNRKIIKLCIFKWSFSRKVNNSSLSHTELDQALKNHWPIFPRGFSFSYHSPRNADNAAHWMSNKLGTRICEPILTVILNDIFFYHQWF